MNLKKEKKSAPLGKYSDKGLNIKNILHVLHATTLGILLPFCLVCAIVSCTGGNSGKNSSSITHPEEFPYVKAPTFITQQEEIIKYAARNYWNGYFKAGEKDTSVYSMDTEQFVKAYVKYVAILNAIVYKNYNIVESSQKKLFAAADSLYLSGHKTPLMRLLSLSENYLYDPNSPYLNEETYIPVLESVIKLKSLDSLKKIQYIWQLDMARLNRVGQKANDFDFVHLTRNKSLAASSLYKIKAEYTLIYFNNPDCSSCKGQLEQLLQNTHISTLCGAGRLKVLSMYIDEQTELWERHSNDVPLSWIYARDAALVLRNNELYGIRAIPSMYLLDKDKRVLLKDANAETVIGYLNNL